MIFRQHGQILEHPSKDVQGLDLWQCLDDVSLVGLEITRRVIPFRQCHGPFLNFPYVKLLGPSNGALFRFYSTLTYRDAIKSKQDPAQG